jgi:polyhydroxyalkanoate synthesis regulator phasin
MKRIILGSALTLLLVPALFAQMPTGEKPAMMPDCAAMMQQHDAMQKHMAEMNAKLQTLVDDMNKAKGSAKVDKTAAVVTELVAQRAMMQKQMMEMHPKMMEHMTQHMQSGMMKGMADSMSGCPMMKGTDKAPAPPAAEHKH